MDKTKEKSMVKEKNNEEWDLVEAITNVSEAFTKLKNAGLNKAAIVVLLRDRVDLPKYKIMWILDELSELKERYCK